MRPRPRSPHPARHLAWRAALVAPRLFRGAALHHAALRAGSAGALGLAGRLFEAAAKRYREDLEVEPLARLRVHQRMFRPDMASPGDPDPVLAVERGLLALDRIESPRPPFVLVDARTLVATWQQHVGRAAVRPAVSSTEPEVSLRLAA